MVAGEENNYHSLFSHGLITDDIQGVVFTGRFTPQGGYDVGNYTPCLRALAQEALAPYFSGHRVEVMRVTQAHPFGVAAARQPTSAVLVTCRAPEGQQLFALPTNMLTPTGKYDHPSHSPREGGPGATDGGDEDGVVPQRQPRGERQLHGDPGRSGLPPGEVPGGARRAAGDEGDASEAPVRERGEAAPEGSGHQRSPGAGAPARAGGEEVERSGRAGVPLPLPQPG